MGWDGMGGIAEEVCACVPAQACVLGYRLILSNDAAKFYGFRCAAASLHA